MSDPTNLPAFLRQRDGALEMVIHCTWAQDHMICPRKFWLYYGEQVESTAPRVALNYGGGVHKPLALRYERMLQGAGLAGLEDEQMAMLQGHFDESPQPGDEWRNAGRAQDLLRAYNEWVTSGEVSGEAGGGWSASAPGLEDFQVLGVEEEFEVRVGEVGCEEGAFDPMGQELPPTVPLYLAGRKDLVVAWNGGLWVMDHKTSTDWGSGESNKQLDEGRRSFQFRGYAWAEREHQVTVREAATAAPRAKLPVLGTIGNYLVSRKPYMRPPALGKASIARNQFHREPYPFSSEVLDEWCYECLDLAREILANWQRGVWPQRFTGCGHWGRCEFFDYCEASASDRAAMLQSSMFRTKDFTREI